MKWLAAFVFLVPFSSSSLAEAAGSFRISLVEGPAKARAAEAPAKWREIRKGMKLEEGSRVRTGARARVEMQAGDGSVVRIGSNSDIELSRARFSGRGRRVGLRLYLGRMWASVAHAVGGKSRFEVRTDNAIAGVRGTSFTVFARDDASALVRVYAGTVGVRKNGGRSDYASRKRTQVPGPSQVSRAEWEEVVAAAMTEVRISSVGKISPAERFEDEGDLAEWAQWNRARDQRKTF